MRDSRIQWTDSTWNPVRGCSLVSPGCTHCYAMRQAHRYSGPGRPYEGLTKRTRAGPVWTGDVRLVPERLGDPIKWRRPRRIFVNSMSDLFHEGVPFEYVAAVFGVMWAAPRHQFQVLTKRPERALEFFRWLAGVPATAAELRAGNLVACAECEIQAGRLVDLPAGGISARRWPLPNVWIGVSVEDQARAHERVPLLLQIPAALRFLSVEPMLGPVDLGSIRDGSWHDAEGATWYDALTGQAYYGDGEHGLGCGPVVDWVIVGGESGPGARECREDWIRALLEQCAGRCPVFVKQLGAVEAKRLCLRDAKGGDPREWKAPLRVREFPESGPRDV